MLNAQQEPQKSWFLTGVTAPASTQFTLLAAVTLAWLKPVLSAALHDTTAQHAATSSHWRGDAYAQQLSPEAAVPAGEQAQVGGRELLPGEVGELVQVQLHA